MTKHDVVQDAKRVIELGIRLLEEQGDIVHFDGEDNPKRMFYLGSILSLSPSGKFYTPWANSNVDVCPMCLGTGNGKAVACHYCNGNGYRTFEALAIVRDCTVEQIKADTNLMDCLKILSVDTFECIGCRGTKIVHDTCSYCDGPGSREAYLDETWRETLESEASKHNAWIEAGEGDACDLFLCREIEQSSKESEKI